MHRREGGFYWHMEVGTGRNIYKAFHWPGFASGKRYDERAVMELMREKAHEIRRLESPPLAPPAPPKLLPIERVSAISWQGSAGADSYEVWRAERPEGPWTKIADDVSDAEVQYRPLFNDTAIAVGHSYWYRIVARNGSGASEASNVIGPVVVDCQTLVDECVDLGLVHETVGGVSLATENARTVQEDCHRFALKSGAAIVYRVNGPVSGCRVYSFARTDATGLEVSISTDGQHYRPLEMERAAFPSGENAYGYLTPILWQGVATGSGSHLRISLPKPPRREGQGNPMDSASPPAPIEISRVEIEYDR
jgi:hypothetical protein